MYKTSKKSVVYLSLLILVILIFGIVAFFTMSEKNTPTKTAETDSINYNPPTAIEVQAGNDIKDDQPSVAQQKPSSTASSPVNVTVVIADAGQYGDFIEVRAFMPQTLQEGECTVVFSKDGEEETFKAPAYPDASSTICNIEDISQDNFNLSGKWDVVVSYKSNNYYGSASSSLEIQ